jgi:hypothetical protein
MSSPGLPETITGSSTGHMGHSAIAWAMLNKFDKDAAPASGDVLTWSGSLWIASAPTGGTGGGGSANMMSVSSTLSARPTVPAGYQLVVVGPTEPSWLVANVDIMFLTAA